MRQTLEQDLELVDEAMNSFVQVMSRPRAWEHLAARADISLDRAGASLLQLVHFSPHECRLSDVARKLGVEAPSVTRKVQQLEHEGLLARTTDPEDRRAFVLQTTSKGRKIVERLHKAKQQLFTEVLRDWPADDRTNFARLFKRLATDMTELLQNPTK